MWFIFIMPYKLFQEVSPISIRTNAKEIWDLSIDEAVHIYKQIETEAKFIGKDIYHVWYIWKSLRIFSSLKFKKYRKTICDK